MKKQESSEFFFSNKIFDICSVLNDPYQKQDLKKSTIKDIPSVPLTQIPKYEISDFYQYLSEISSEYDRYSLNKKNKTTDSFCELDIDNLKLGSNEHNLYSSNCSTSFDKSSELLDVKKEISPHVSLDKIPESIEGSLSSVPSVYFKSNFELENSRIFDLVTDSSTIFAQNSVSGESKTFSNNTILQEKLSWYLDIVEVHLIKEINNASTSFFKIIDYLQDLYEESSVCVNRIKELRNKLSSNNNALVEPRLKIMEIMEKKENLNKLNHVLKHIYNILYKLSEVRDLIKRNEYISALDMINKINEEMKQNIDNSEDMPLSKISALSSVAKELEILTEDIKNKLSLEFANVLIEDHKQVISSLSFDAILKVYSDSLKINETNKSINSNYIDLDQDLQEKIKTIIMGIYMTNSIESALEHYYDMVLKEVKNIIIQSLLFKNDNNSTNINQLLNSMTREYSVLVNSLREMTPEDFLQMIGTIYAKIYLFIERLVIYQKFILNITSNLTNKFNFVYKSISTTSIDITDILESTIDIAQIEIVKVLNIRTPQNTKLLENDIFRFFALHNLFLSRCEMLTGKFGELLQETVLLHIKESISNYHSEKMSLEASILDKDQWIPEKEITEEFQNVINCIIDSAIFDPVSWKKDFFFNETENLKSSINSIDTVDKKLKSSITIKNENYFVTASLISLFLIVESYAKILILIPPVAYDISNNLLELLELYNFKVYQLILGAGATKTSGFKTITAKHLALASHSISLVICLISYILEFMKRHSGTIDLSEFDQLIKAYVEHQEQIHLKFVSIISDRLDLLLNSPLYGLKTLDWSKELSKTEDGTLKPHIYMESLVKDTLTLYKVLKKYLKQDITQNIMSEILNIYLTVLPKEFSSLPLETENLKNHVLLDLTYFADNLTILGSIGKETGYKIIKNVESMFEKNQK
ncbi:hypothetical protein PMAC_002672 [Pneumocystis sp. 'macacae']|nr:hypothetical protein PMAC_002672 [Pneumocystis sp. 'macacae']